MIMLSAKTHEKLNPIRGFAVVHREMRNREQSQNKQLSTPQARVIYFKKGGKKAKKEEKDTKCEETANKHKKVVKYKSKSHQSPTFNLPTFNTKRLRSNEWGIGIIVSITLTHTTSNFSIPHFFHFPNRNSRSSLSPSLSLSGSVLLQGFTLAASLLCFALLRYVLYSLSPISKSRPSDLLLLLSRVFFFCKKIPSLEFWNSVSLFVGTWILIYSVLSFVWLLRKCRK